jgi:hypothetical protein
MSEVRRVADVRRLELDTPRSDRTIAALAARQHGVVSAVQLARLGLAQRAVSQRRRPRGRLRVAPQGLVVEPDGYRYHRSRRAFERGTRDAALTRAGYRTLRFSHRQLAHAPDAVAATVAAALGRR